MLKNTVKSIARTAGYDVIRVNSGGNAELSRGIVSTFAFKDQELSFFILDEWDYIQGHHLKGKFYEEQELALIGEHFSGGLFVDVGANIGNHTIYALKVLGASRVIAFEPNPAAARILRVNLALNDLAGTVEHRPVGLSDRISDAKLVAPRHRDLGSFRISAEGNGADCRVVRGDDELLDEPSIAFIKIDTEAMELAVLGGLTKTIERHRPKLFVEVDDTNREAFLAFAQQHNYAVAEIYRRYATNSNFLIVPAA